MQCHLLCVYDSGANSHVPREQHTSVVNAMRRRIQAVFLALGATCLAAMAGGASYRPF
jgi:hypothetical protein